jgi:MFS family permease
MIVLGILLAALSAAGPISRLLQRADVPGGLDLSILTSLLSVVVVIAFFAGIAYGLVAIPAQTQLQEDLPEDVRGRVFGILNLVVSVASFVPIIVIAPISDVVGTTAVIFVLAIAVVVIGVLSVVTRGPLQPTEARPASDPNAVDPITGALLSERPLRTESVVVPPPQVPPVPQEALVAPAPQQPLEPQVPPTSPVPAGRVTHLNGSGIPVDASYPDLSNPADATEHD